jgi:competence protein ComEC
MDDPGHHGYRRRTGRHGPTVMVVGNQVSIAAVPANLIVAPLVAPITILGLLAMVISPIWPTAASLVVQPAAALGGLIASIASWAAGIHWAVLSWQLGVTLMALAGLGYLVSRTPTSVLPNLIGQLRSYRHFWLSGAGGVCVILPLLLITRSTDPPDWRAVACDVGQGSATLLRSVDTTVLIDVGPGEGRVLDCLSDAGVTHLSSVVLTHLHQDHIGDLANVLQTIPTKNIYVTAAHMDPTGLAALPKKSTRPQLLVAGDRLSTPDLTAQVIWPDAATPTADKNDGSLVIRFTWPDQSTAITTGDVAASAQDHITHTFAEAASTFVTVPHHGSADLDPDFAAWLDPQIAVVSSGIGNGYGHPSQESLASFGDQANVVLRTDTTGSIAVDWNTKDSSWWRL